MMGHVALNYFASGCKIYSFAESVFAESALFDYSSEIGYDPPRSILEGKRAGVRRDDTSVRIGFKRERRYAELTVLVAHRIVKLVVAALAHAEQSAALVALYYFNCSLTRQRNHAPVYRRKKQLRHEILECSSAPRYKHIAVRVDYPAPQIIPCGSISAETSSDIRERPSFRCEHIVVPLVLVRIAVVSYIELS